MQALISMAGSAAALILCIVSAAMNYLFLSSLGKTPLEGQVLGAASAAADVLKALLPFLIAWSWQARRFVAAGAGSLAFVFFAGFSLLSAIGFAADNRLVLVDRRGDVTNTYARVQRDLSSLEDQRAALPGHRPPAVVAEEIERHRQNRRWTATKNCTNATEPESRAFCAAFFALRAELAAGQEAARLRSEIAASQSQAEQLRQSGAGQDSDPQVTLLSRMSGQKQESVRLALIIAVALLVEIGASLGLFLASGRIVQPVAIASPAKKPEGCIEDFCLEALAASSRSVLTSDELLRCYRGWCAQRVWSPVADDIFFQRFNALAQAIGVPYDQNGYRNLAICES